MYIYLLKFVLKVVDVGASHTSFLESAGCESRIEGVEGHEITSILWHITAYYGRSWQQFQLTVAYYGILWQIMSILQQIMADNSNSSSILWQILAEYGRLPAYEHMVRAVASSQQH